MKPFWLTTPALAHYFYLRRVCGYSPRSAYTSTALWYSPTREDLYRRLSYLRNRP